MGLEIRRMSAAEAWDESQTLSARWLNEFNAKLGLDPESRPMVIQAKLDGELLGVLTGSIAWQWLYIKRLAIQPGYRRRGLGKALLLCAEDLARDEDLKGMAIDTFTFQAEAFYLSQGFRECGRITGYPPGESRVWLAKRF